MKGFFALALFVAAVCLVNSKATKEISEKLRSAVKTCTEKLKLDGAQVEEYIKHRKLPDTEDGKCAVLCYFKEMKYVENDKFNSENVEKSNKEKWDDEAVVAKATELYKTCLHEVAPANENVDCERAAKMLGCLKKGGEEKSIPLPELS